MKTKGKSKVADETTLLMARASACDCIGKIGRKTVRCGGERRMMLLPNGERKMCKWNGCWIENGKMVHYKDGKVVPPPGERTERLSTRSSTSAR